VKKRNFLGGCAPNPPLCASRSARQKLLSRGLRPQSLALRFALCPPEASLLGAAPPIPRSGLTGWRALAWSRVSISCSCALLSQGTGCRALVPPAGFEPAPPVSKTVTSASWATGANGTAGRCCPDTRCLEGSYASATPQRHMVPSAGHDPATLRLRVACAARLRHDGSGATGRIRTPISSLKRRVRCRYATAALVLSAGFEPAHSRV
jgi:hypothetical protein